MKREEVDRRVKEMDEPYSKKFSPEAVSVCQVRHYLYFFSFTYTVLKLILIQYLYLYHLPGPAQEEGGRAPRLHLWQERRQGGHVQRMVQRHQLAETQGR